MSGKVSGINIMFFIKYNWPLLKGPIQNRTKDIVLEVLEDLECEVEQIRIYSNRVQIQFVYSPRLSISKIMNRVMGRSSCLLRKEFPDLVR